MLSWWPTPRPSSPTTRPINTCLRCLEPGDNREQLHTASLTARVSTANHSADIQHDLEFDPSDVKSRHAVQRHRCASRLFKCYRCSRFCRSKYCGTRQRGAQYTCASNSCPHTPPSHCTPRSNHLADCPSHPESHQLAHILKRALQCAVDPANKFSHRQSPPNQPTLHIHRPQLPSVHFLSHRFPEQGTHPFPGCPAHCLSLHQCHIQHSERMQPNPGSQCASRVY
mmetsp:Transcript_5859/g.12011  ORF Transcript_5859/g.12011 Transcript_5859/m.12011 type:complete len:226 (-) Transcript_5859:2059-2736(-)